MELEALCSAAKAAKYEIAAIETEKKNEALLKIADLLVQESEAIIIANARDITTATTKGMSIPLIDRLRLTEDRIKAMSEGLKQVAELPDPLSDVLDEWELPNGLKLKKVRVPLGVIGIIY